MIGRVMKISRFKRLLHTLRMMMMLLWNLMRYLQRTKELETEELEVVEG
jgi:hypothetical protein